MKRLLVIVMLLAVLGTGTSLAQTPVSSEFTYQGQLKGGGMPYNGTATLRFQLYDDETGGWLVGTNSKPDVPVDNGLFTVTLDFGSEAFTGDARWLEIAVYEMGVGYVTLTPRQPLKAAPYALYALNGGGGGSLWSQNGNDIYYAAGDVGVGTVTPLYPLHVSSSGSTTTYTQNSAPGGIALYATADGTTGRGIYAQATSGTGVTYGVEAYVQSPNGFALYGFNEADSGSANAVRGECGSPDGVAVFGWAGNDSGIGATIGVKGRIDNPSGAALYGEATAGMGTANGVYAQTASTDGSGVFGQNTSAAGDNEGVFGVSWSPTGKGVFGYNGSTDSGAIGVLGRTSHGYGVRGEATHTTAPNCGVYGTSSSSSGCGVAGYATADSGESEGVRGESASPDGKGVVGVAGPGGIGDGAGVWGTLRDSGNVGQLGTLGCGVKGETDSGNSAGVFGANYNTSGVSSGIAVHGHAYGSSGCGVSGLATGTDGMATGVSGTTWGRNGTGVYGSAVAIGGTTVGVKGLTQSPDGTAVYGVAYLGGTGARFEVDAGSAGAGNGVAIDQDAGVSHDVAALRIDCVGEEEPLGLDVAVTGSFGKLARFNLSGSNGYVSPAFRIEAETSGRVLELVGNNASSLAATLYAQAEGAGEAVYAVQTRASSDTPAVYGRHTVTDYYGIGVKGEGGYRGVEGRVTATGSSAYTGVYAYASGGTGTCRGLFAQATGGGANYGVYGTASGGTTNYAGYFSGNVHVSGTLSKGGGSFKIDHPLDPENKYLLHSFVESPDMMNVYNGNVMLDADGTAVVTLPDWFEALNRDFRYQLTPIGGPGPDLHVAEEVSGNQFKIAGGRPSLKVSWQVTGVRHDPFAEANRIPVEQIKTVEERGTYLHPEARGLPAELQVDRVLKARSEAARLEALVNTVGQAQEPSLPAAE